MNPVRDLVRRGTGIHEGKPEQSHVMSVFGIACCYICDGYIQAGERYFAVEDRGFVHQRCDEDARR